MTKMKRTNLEVAEERCVLQEQGECAPFTEPLLYTPSTHITLITLSHSAQKLPPIFILFF